MKKISIHFLIIAFFSIASFPFLTHAETQLTTQAELLKQIETLKSLVKTLENKPDAKKEVVSNSKIEKGISYIESGEITLYKKNKIAKGYVMFGLGDKLTIETKYSNQKNVLNDVLKEIKKKRPTAKYVDKDNVIIKIDNKTDLMEQAKNAGMESVIKQIVNQVRPQAEIVYNLKNFSYAGVCTDSSINSILEKAKNSSNKSIKSIITSISTVSSDNAVTCHSNSLEYAIIAPISYGSKANNAWCVDSTGFAGPVSIKALGANDFTCK